MRGALDLVVGSTRWPSFWGGAASAQLAMLKKRTGSDPMVNWDIIRNNATGEIILDFILSDPRADIVEWNAYRHARLGKTGGVALYAISRRAYGDKAREFLVAVEQSGGRRSGRWRLSTRRRCSQAAERAVAPS